ncbi:MAG: putative Ig domain-containing protein [bacterium]
MNKIYIAIVLFLLAFAVPVTVYSLVNGDFDIRNEASEDGNLSTPQIVSVPVTEATVGEKYNYLVKAVDNDLVDISSLDFIIDQKPSWIDWDNSRNLFSGTPTISDVGTDSVSLKVSDGKWLGTQKFNIEVSRAIVEEEEESQVIQGEETSQFDDYGFEPIAENTTTDSEPLVLGAEDTELPQTADMGVVVGISLGFAVLILSLYLWLDSKFQFTDRFTKKIEFALGRQTSFQLDNGLTVKRRKSRL